MAAAAAAAVFFFPATFYDLAPCGTNMGFACPSLCAELSNLTLHLAQTVDGNQEIKNSKQTKQRQLPRVLQTHREGATATHLCGEEKSKVSTR